MSFGMIVNMLQKMLFVLVLLTAGFSMGCEISTLGPVGSRHQTKTGVSETGYPGGQPVDAESPALSSSTETKYAKPEVIAKSAGLADNTSAK